jgi:hypothetical protein
MKNPRIIDITPENLEKYGVGCIRDKKHPGVAAKKKWYLQNYPKGVRMKQLYTEGKYGGFIEYVTGERAWRPVEAEDYLFIHCIWVYPGSNLNLGFGSMLVKSVIEEAKKSDKSGVAVTTSEGSWLAGRKLFMNIGFSRVDSKDRFDLLAYPLKAGKLPAFPDWESRSARYTGTHLLLSHQCPANAKALNDIQGISAEMGIDLKTEIVESDSHAREMPSGFGVFQLVHSRKVIQDHYISGTRFKNIVNKELK